MASGPSAKKLQMAFELTPGDAKALKAAMTAVPDWGSAREIVRSAERVLRAVDTHLKAYGVEVLFQGGPWPTVLYVNRGDTYDQTMVFDRTGSRARFFIGSWGDHVDRWEKIGGSLHY